MGNDALIAALLRAADYINNDGSTLSATATANVIETLRDHAATLRQQAFSQFANPEALADWLDALHECHADGSVGNRKWEAAQVAARAIRSLNEPSGNSGQLRQQDGGVPEVPEGAVDTRAHFGAPCVAIIFDSHENAERYRTKLTEAMQLQQNVAAALAQNTQGDGEVTEDAIRQAQDVYEAACNEPSDYFGIEAVLKLHAERARVPDGWSAWHDDESRTWAVRSPAGDVCEVHDRAGDVHAEVLRQLAQDIAAAARARR